MKSISIPKCGIYKYVYHGEIIYIGKSDSSIPDRIIAHETEEKFQKYLKEAEIYYFECKNPAETTIYETALINRYRPVLNVSMNYHGTQEFKVEEKEWKRFQQENIVDIKSMTQKEQHLFLSSLKRNIILPFQKEHHGPDEIIEFISDSPMPYDVHFSNNVFRLVLWYMVKENNTYICISKWKYIKEFIDFWQQQWLQDSDQLYENYYAVQDKINGLMQQLEHIRKALDEQIISV